MWPRRAGRDAPLGQGLRSRRRCPVTRRQQEPGAGCCPVGYSCCFGIGDPGGREGVRDVPVSPGGVDEQGVFRQGWFDASPVADGGEQLDHLGPVVIGVSGLAGQLENPHIWWVGLVGVGEPAQAGLRVDG